MDYTPHLYKSRHSFESVQQKAKHWFASLSEKEQKDLIEDLGHGAGHLTNTGQLNAYNAKYGEIHQAKLLQAYEHIPDNVWSESEVSVIDYGCGQGIAEMVLSDYLTSRYVDNNYIRDFTLIEPSRTNLQQCIKYVNAFYFDSKAGAGTRHSIRDSVEFFNFAL